jgi:hypothetical protein
MAIEINAGDTFNVSCPIGENPILSTGDTLPDEKEILAKVLKIKKEVVTLGPFKTGTISFSLPCSSSNVAVQANIKELDPKVANQRFAPLNAEKIDYPLGFYIACFLIIFSVFGGFFYYINKRKNKVTFEEKKKNNFDPRVELEKYILHCEINVQNPESAHLHEIYKYLRHFLENELNLNTNSLTTGEFIGTFRAMGLTQSKNQNLISQLEYVLKTADDVRFAKKTINSKLWQDYLIKIKTIFLAFPKKDIPKSSDKKENSR